MKKDIFDIMFIPRDAVLKEYNISMVGNGQLFVEGFEAIKELGNEQLKLRVKNGFIVVNGKGLFVEYFGEGEIMVKGRILNVQLL